jgi:hypothetical protein
MPGNDLMCSIGIPKCHERALKGENVFRGKNSTLGEVSSFLPNQ